METYKEKVAALLNEHVKFYFEKVLNQFRVTSVRETTDASYFFTEFVSNCAVTDTMFLMNLANSFFDIASWVTTQDHEYHNVRQNAVWGICVLGKAMDPMSFKMILKKSQELVDHMLSNNFVGQEDYLEVFENAVIAQGIISLKHDQTDAQINKFLGYLPLKGESEAQYGHDLLLQAVVRGEPCVLSNPNLKSTLGRIVDAAKQDGDILTDESKEQLEQALKM